MSRRSHRVFRFFVVLVVLALCGPWMVRPLLYAPQGLHSMGWTESQLILDRYPIHLVSPDWLTDKMYWSLVETGARSFMVLVACLLPFVLIRSTGNEDRSA